MSDFEKPQPDQPAPGREPAILLPGVILALLGLLVAIHIAREVILNPEADAELALWLAFVPYRAIIGQQAPDLLLPLIWTPFTHALLHAGWEHLIFNCAWLAIFGTPVARRYGVVPTLVLFFLSAAVGALFFAVTVLPENQWLVGASGGVAGLTGAACRFMFQPVLFTTHPETGERIVLGRRLASFGELVRDSRARFFIGLWLVLNAAVPFMPLLFGQGVGIAWQAHLGGFLVGLLLVPVFERRPRSMS